MYGYLILKRKVEQGMVIVPEFLSVNDYIGVTAPSDGNSDEDIIFNCNKFNCNTFYC